MREELKAAPHTSLNEPIGNPRRFEGCRRRWRIKSIRAALGGTVNESSSRSPPAASERCSSPAASCRRPGPARDGADERAVGERALALGNGSPRCSWICPSRQRIRFDAPPRDAARSEALKATGQAQGSAAVIEIARMAPPLLHCDAGAGAVRDEAVQPDHHQRAGRAGHAVRIRRAGERVHPLVLLAAEHASASPIGQLRRQRVLRRRRGPRSGAGPDGLPRRHDSLDRGAARSRSCPRGGAGGRYGCSARGPMHDARRSRRLRSRCPRWIPSACAACSEATRSRSSSTPSAGDASCSPRGRSGTSTRPPRAAASPEDAALADRLRARRRRRRALDGAAVIPEFFRITKRLHNMLHGQVTGAPLGEAERDAYERCRLVS